MRCFLFAFAMLAIAAPSAFAQAEDYMLMNVNGQKVTKSEVDRMWAGLFPEGQAPDLNAMQPEMRDKVLRGIMTERLLLQEAAKAGVEKSPAFQRDLAEVRRKLVVRHFLDTKTPQITEEELKREYDRLVGQMRNQKELRARHILVESEKQAQDLRKQLDSGKSFEELARQYSKDPGSAKRGGDLGYFTREKMVKPFADAAFAMKKGEISKPVKSQFGWHIIKLEDTRPISLPTFVQVKEQLRASLQDRKLGSYIEGLVSTAEVTVYDAKGKAQPFTKEIAKPAAPAAKK